VLAAAAIANRNSRRFSVISRSLQANYSEVAIAEVERNRFLQSDLNEAACGGGRYAWARSKIFLSQSHGGGIGSVVTDKCDFAKCRIGDVSELLSGSQAKADQHVCVEYSANSPKASRHGR